MSQDKRTKAKKKRDPDYEPNYYQCYKKEEKLCSKTGKDKNKDVISSHEQLVSAEGSSNYFWSLT